jgi:hypothetical protein
LGVYNAILRVQNLLLLLLLMLVLVWVVGRHVLRVLQTRALLMRVLYPTVARRYAPTPMGEN